MSIFTSKKDLKFLKRFEIFEKNSADKIWSNKFKGIKMSFPMPERIKGAKASLTELLSWERDSILIWSWIELLNFQTAPADKNSRLSDFSSLASYVIPTVRVKQYIKLELGLEAILQLTMKLMLLAYAASETRTSHTLVLFFKANSSNVGVLICMILQSLFSYMKSHVSMVGAGRHHFPIKVRN